MAETDNGIISTIAQIVEKFVGDYSLWLWLTIFGLTVVLLDRYNVISISDISTDRHSLTIAGISFVCCMLLNAIRLQDHIFNLVKQSFESAASANEARRLQSRKSAYNATRDKEHKAKFKEIMYIDCKERMWLLWFIFVYKPRTKKRYFVYNEIHGTNGDFILWRDEIAERLVRIYRVLKVIGPDKAVELTYSRDLITESFDFEMYLKELIAVDGELKSKLRVERDYITSLLPTKTEYNTYDDMLKDTRIFIESEKPFFFYASQKFPSQEPGPIVESDLLS
jgi:hypothetical protein